MKLDRENLKIIITVGEAKALYREIHRRNLENIENGHYMYPCKELSRDQEKIDFKRNYREAFKGKKDDSEELRWDYDPVNWDYNPETGELSFTFHNQIADAILRPKDMPATMEAAEKAASDFIAYLKRDKKPQDEDLMRRYLEKREKEGRALL